MVPLTQQYVCNEGDTTEVFAWGEWADAVETPKGWRKVRTTERPSVDKVEAMTLIPVAAQDVRDHTFEGDNIYYCEPANEAQALTWHILNRQMKSGKLVFMARGALRQGKDKLWKLELFQGFPVLREIIFPGTIRDAPEVDSMRIDKDTQDLVGQFIEQSMSSWDDVDTADSWQDQFNKWVNAGELVQVNDAEASDTQSPDDLIAGLQEAVKKSLKK